MKTSGVFLLYVRKFSMFSLKDELFVYKVTSKDIFHTMGEMLYRSLEHISRIDFAEYSSLKAKFWSDHGVEILNWSDKY